MSATLEQKTVVRNKMAAYLQSLKHGHNSAHKYQWVIVTYEKCGPVYGDAAAKEVFPWPVPVRAPLHYCISREDHAEAGTWHYHAMLEFSSGSGYSLHDLVKLCWEFQQGRGVFHGSINVTKFKALYQAVGYAAKHGDWVSDDESWARAQLGKSKEAKAEKKSELKDAFAKVTSGQRSIDIFMSCSSPGIFMQRKALQFAESICTAKKFAAPLGDRIKDFCAQGGSRGPESAACSPYRPDFLSRVQRDILQAIAFFIKSPTLSQRQCNFMFVTPPGCGKTTLLDALASSGVISVFKTQVTGRFWADGWSDATDIVLFDEFNAEAVPMPSLKVLTSTAKIDKLEVKGSVATKSRKTLNLFFTNKFSEDDWPVDDKAAMIDRFSSADGVPRMVSYYGDADEDRLHIDAPRELSPEMTMASLMQFVRHLDGIDVPEEAAAATEADWDHFFDD